MTATGPHLESEKLASSAHEALRAREIDKARALFADAARAETDAFDAVPDGKLRTLGILAVSSASLWFKAGDFHAAELFIHRALGNSSLPPFARRELREILQAIWNVSVPEDSKVSSKPSRDRLAEVILHCMEARRLAEAGDNSLVDYLLAMVIQETREAIQQQASTAAKKPPSPTVARG